MFFDTITSQSSAQNVNLQNIIDFGGGAYGGFSPVNETKPEFKATNDLGLSLGFLGGTAGAVGMSKSEATEKSGSAFTKPLDGYKPREEQNGLISLLKNVAIAAAAALSAFALYRTFKKGK